MLRRLADEGKRVVIWGSGSKAVSFLTTLRVPDLIAAVVDINPHKHGKFLAGTGHEIVGPRALARYGRTASCHEHDLFRRDPR